MLDRNPEVVSSRLFDALFGTSLSWIYIIIIDARGIVVKANPAFFKSSGYTEDEVIGKPLRAFFTPSSQVIYNEQFPLLLEKGENRNRIEFICKDGKTLVIDCFASAVRDDREKITGFVVFQLDITRYIEAEDHIFSLTTLLDTTREGISIIDSRGNYAYVNKAYAELFGYSAPDDLIGKPSAMLCSDDAHATFALEVMPQISENGYWRGELEGRRKDGSVFPQAVCLTQFKGDTLICVTRDITEQRLLHNKLQHNLDIQKVINLMLQAGMEDLSLDHVLHQILQIILSIDWLSFESRGAIFLVDGDNRTLIMKAQRNLDVAIQNACSRVEFGKCLCGRAAETGNVVYAADIDERHDITYEGILPHGHYNIPIKFREKLLGVLNIYTKAGHPYDSLESDFLVALANTLALIINKGSMEKQMATLEYQLCQSQKMEALGRLSGGIAHDLNNLLSPIIGYSEMVLEDLPQDHPKRDSLIIIQDAAEKAAALTRQILTFSRKQSLNPEAVDLNMLIKNITNFICRLIRSNIELKIILSDIPLSVFVDVVQIEQVLINLVTNARDAMPDGGVLTIETGSIKPNGEFMKAHNYDQGTYGFISVTDTGVGMDKDTRERMFEPFFTTKETGKGTGLGLAVSYGIVKQHNGFINVCSELGKGTTIRVCLPLSGEKVNESNIANTAPVTITGKETCKETILLADDNNLIKDMLVSSLKDAGYRVITAGDGEDAINKFIENQDSIDIVLLDIMMPKKNGIEVYKEIRKIRADVKSIFISGYPSDIIHDSGISIRDLNYISKPVSPRTIREKIRELLDGNGIRVQQGCKGRRIS